MTGLEKQTQIGQVYKPNTDKIIRDFGNVIEMCKSIGIAYCIFCKPHSKVDFIKHSRGFGFGGECDIAFDRDIDILSANYWICTGT